MSVWIRIQHKKAVGATSHYESSMKKKIKPRSACRSPAAKYCLQNCLQFAKKMTCRSVCEQTPLLDFINIFLGLISKYLALKPVFQLTHSTLLLMFKIVDVYSTRQLNHLQYFSGTLLMLELGMFPNKSAMLTNLQK